MPILPFTAARASQVDWTRAIRAVAGGSLLVGAILLGARGGPPWHAVLAAAMVTLGLGLGTKDRLGWAAAGRTALGPALAVGLLALSADAGVKVWQAPARWADVLALSPVGAGLAMAMVLGASLWHSGRHDRPGPAQTLTLLALPYLFAALFLLGSPHLLAEPGSFLAAGAGPTAALVLGRTILLLTLSEIMVVGIGWLMDRRWTRDLRVHGLLVASALFAALTPQLASLGASAPLAALPRLLQIGLVPATAAIALAGLWAQTFLSTGIVLDALRGRRPTFVAALDHWRGGAAKGAVYSGVFMLIVQVLALVAGSPTARALFASAPALGGALAGAALFPLARTIIESFDGSAPFFARLARNATAWTGYARGTVIGAGIGLLLAAGLPLAGSYTRFACGFAIGAAAYGGIDLLVDGASIVRGRRLRFQTWRLYALGLSLGGVVGGAVAWYADAAQIAAVTTKFWSYAGIYYPANGRPVENYVIYPLFSKWGATNLGPVAGGVRLLYDESLSGIINWSLAAPLFSINLVLLTALVERSLQPLRGLLSARGLVGMVEQAIRVLRWGLWMAPVIYSFLRMAPDPTWYNQDGAVRTVVATIQSWHLSPDAFRAWSLQVFLGLLAYDWFRVLIWFDHMGLRVATLVNLSFIGGDIVDERAARALGHSGRTHVIPEAIRRFATWAPLLIPFYIPRGSEWDYVWSEAERMQAAAPGLLPPVGTVLVGYGLFALVALGLALGLRRRSRAAAVGVLPAQAPAVAPPFDPDRWFRLSNGLYTFTASADGRTNSHALRGGRGPEIDLNRRSDDPLLLTGKFFYLRAQEAEGRLWSVGWQPVRHAGPDYEVTQPSPTSLRFVNSCDGVRVEATVTVAEREALELWRLRLVNLTDRPRTIELTSYQELAINGWDGYRRTPSYNNLHVATCFVRALGAIIARNRLLKPSRPAPGASYPFAREVAFHAVGAVGAAKVDLIGYQDARPCFIGSGTLADPEALTRGRMRSVEDEGQLYGFDPIASLQLLIELPPDGSAELLFVDGYAADETAAARTIAHRLGRPMPDRAHLAARFTRPRILDSTLRPPFATELPYRFSPDGTELHLSGPTPRPWTHVLANPLGHGAVVSNDGEIFSFAANAQQNGLTPCNLDSVPCQLPGQAIYVVDVATGEVDTPCFVPHRRSDARHEVTFGRGYAVFRKRRDDLELELTVFVSPDQPVELRLLTIRNHGVSAARYRVVPYLEMMLAELPSDSRGGLEVRADAAPGALFFRNPRNAFHRGWAFVATSLACEHRETVRRRFLGGPEHDLECPYLVATGQSDTSQPDDGRRVASFVGHVDVPAGGQATISLALGQVAGFEEADRLARAYADVATVERAFDRTRQFWTSILGTLRIETNQPAFDRLVNDWLPYQVLSARLWGRTGPNQRGGAFGFRDQLQDVLSLLLLQPELARRQILLHAAQQFVEGDVLQWWHRSWEGKTGLGARNRASDPHLWLPYVVTRYVRATGDHAILDEPVPFLEGRAVPRGSEGIVIVPRPSRDVVTLYEHCRRAIGFTLSRMGTNGLPLIGTHDWNDGLSDIGHKGRGESGWLGFFLHDVLTGFSGLAARRGETAEAARCMAEAKRLQASLERMWRGDRYVRAITDDGEELQWLDALMGSWPILSGAVAPARGREALEGALAGLEQENVILLLTPPFTEQSPIVPGKIADYPPGVRENGGQYSHGSSWLVDAAVLLAEQAHAAGEESLAAHLRERAFALWRKISPLGKTDAELLDVYGLPPHQQPADIYFGPGYEGHGGWSWYTGAAGRMLSAAYALLGLRLSDGELRIAENGPGPHDALRLHRVIHRGRVLAAPSQPATQIHRYPASCGAGGGERSVADSKSSME
ncbi:GH36-type glycosyl hydrolase domain-containing protein [Benzoatithermus flavus]|uniref:Glycosyl transferase family 36 n=1 Tax=Benzoatithermus flavus TaxID=3108223 RepID=A0ABU8XWE6_9PROT